MLHVLVPEENTCSQRATASVSLNDNIQLLYGHSEFFMSRDQEITFLAGIIDSDHQEAMGLLSMP